VNINAKAPAIAIGTNRRSTTVTFRSAARMIALGYVATMAGLIATGLLLTQTLKTSKILRWDERVARQFANHRTPSQTHLSAFWSRSADAPSIILIALVAGIVLAIGRNWREVLWLTIIVPTELAFFLTVSYAVGRPRPNVAHLGSVPSTGSFPSGHVAVTIVLYGTIAMILAAHIHEQTASRVVAFLAWGWTVVASGFVGWARMYRGMHHPLDVAAGALLGCAVLFVGFGAFRCSTKHTHPRANSSQASLLSNPTALEHRFSEGERT
jgi:membrane-associated phospholipid phosphatase